MDTRILLLLWRPAWRVSSGTYSHQLPYPVDFRELDSDSPLPLRTALKVINGNRLPANNEESLIRLAQPIVKACDSHAQPPRCILG